MKNIKSSFTLIELLIVIGILSILVVTILITLNPSEAQKKTRDTKRMKDLTTLQAIVQQWINDGKEPFCTSISGCFSSGAGANVQGLPCSGSWIRQGAGDYSNPAIDLCNYTKIIPTDPRNNVQTRYVDGSGSPPISSGTTNFTYRISMSGSDYKIGGLLESIANVNNAVGDGGTYPTWVEVFSGETGKNLW